MAWRPIYLGRNAVFCVKEGKCIENIGKRGVDTFKEAKAIIRSILRDFEKGYTYDHYGNVREMDRRLAVRRLNFLYLLAKRHGMNEEDYQKMIREIERAKRKLIEMEVKQIKQRIEKWDVGRRVRQRALTF